MHAIPVSAVWLVVVVELKEWFFSIWQKSVQCPYTHVIRHNIVFIWQNAILCHKMSPEMSRLIWLPRMEVSLFSGTPFARLGPVYQLTIVTECISSRESLLQKVGCQNLDKKFRFSDLPCYCYTFVHYIYASIVQEIVINKIYSIKAK